MNCSSLKWIVIATLLSGSSSLPPHKFLRQPFNATTKLGERAVLRCAIENKQTPVQWTIDGFGLGTSFKDPRLSFQGLKSLGEYNLQITDVRLTDDGPYSCQAGPDVDKGLSPLKSRDAYLTVIVPPKQIELERQTSGAIDVKFPGKVTITCTVPDTKPASDISWKVRGADYIGVVSKKIAAGTADKLVTTASSIVLQPTKEENGTSVECVVNHRALDAPVSRVATLNVLYPPSPPKISGFRSEPMQSGEVLRVSCAATGGNPLAKITWLIGPEVVQKDFRHTRRTTQSLLSYKLRPKDNEKVLTCRAENPALDGPLEEQVRLQVFYPPENIVIERHPEEGTQENGVMTFTCHYPDSNPRASLAWFIGDVKLPLQWSNDVASIPYMIRNLRSEDSAGRIELTLTSVRRQDADLTIKCRATVPEIGFTEEVTTHPKVNYPPRKVDVSVVSPLTTPITIPLADDHIARNSGTDSNEQLAYKAGDIVLLRCVAKGGNPPPNLTWYLDGRPVTVDEKTAISDTEVKVQTERNGDDTLYGEFITTSTMELTLQASHNDASVSCVAGHGGYSETLMDVEKLKVAFPPETLSVEQFPSLLVAGNPMSLTCKTSSSYPVAEISWYKDDVKVPSHYFVTLPPTKGEFGGIVAESRLKITPTANDDRGSFTCRAEVQVLQETITQPYKLQVEYQPVFYPMNGNNTSYNTTEGDSFIEIEVVARANPYQMTFAWFRITSMKNGVDGPTVLTKNSLTKNRRFVWMDDRGLLRINQLKREDGGIYMVRATNSRGSSDLNITLNVFYPPVIVSVSGPTTALTEGQTAKLRCDFRSHPLAQPRVTWIKEAPGSGRSKYDVQTLPEHSILTLEGLTAADRGGYKCVVDNGVGDEVFRRLQLPLIYTPVFADATPTKVAVSSVGSDGKLFPDAILHCVVHSTPSATITWASDNNTINAAEDDRYSILQEVLGSETTRSSLTVNRISHKDAEEREGTLAEYICEASNTQGQSRKRIQVVLQGPPDAPSALKVYNLTSSSVHLIWERGFNGGVRQRFVVQYSEYTKDMFDGEFEEITSQTTSRTITNLEQHKEYIFRVVAKNDYGQSAPSGVVASKTMSSMEQESAGIIFGVKRGYIVALGVVFVVVFIVLIVVAVLTFRRCRIAKQTYKPKTIETDCESLTHAESSASSRSSSCKRHEREKLVDNNCQVEEKREESILEPGSGRRLLQDETDEMAIPLDTFEPGQSYFDCSASRCSSHHSADTSEDPGIRTNGYGFSSFKSGAPKMADAARQGLFSFGSRSARTGRSPVTEERITRKCSEPRFRFDVIPTDDCLANLHDTGCDRPLDLPLPPALPPYEHCSYGKRPGAGSTCDVRSSCNYIGARDYKSGSGPSSFRQYRTLEPPKFSFDPCYEGCGVPESRTSFGRSNSVQHPSVTSGNSVDACLYNLVSRPPEVEEQGYATSVLSMPCNSNDDYVTKVARVRGSQSSASSNGSGLYARSFDNMMNQQDNALKRASVVNDDGSINTYGLDFPPPPLDIIRESQSQDPLQSISTLQDYQYRGSSAIASPSAVNERFGRKSSLKGVTSTLPAKKAPTPSVRFRDELAKALNNQRPQDLEFSTQQRRNEHSDDDADSGCGGSADVAVHSDPYPVSPTGGKNSAFSPVICIGDNEEMVLRV